MTETQLRQLFGGRDLGGFFRCLLPRLGGLLGSICRFGGLLLAALWSLRGLARLLAARRAPRLWTELVGAGVKEHDRLRQRDRFRRPVAGDGRVDAVMIHIGPIAAILDDNRPAFVRVFTQNLAGIGTEATALLGIGLLLCNQGDCAIES